MQNIYQHLQDRGLISQSTSPDLAEFLSQPRTVYAGFDPTADSLHVGNLMGLVMLIRFHRFGHHVIPLVGCITAAVGDPSGKTCSRDELGQDVAGKNAHLVTNVISRVLANANCHTPILNNKEWLEAPLLASLMGFGRHVSVGELLGKEHLRSRLETGLSYAELSYLILQAADFWWLHRQHKCDVQLGGSDQWGNITLGCEAIRKASDGQSKVYGLTWPLLTKKDGTKFGKTESGAVWLSESKTTAYDFFQFWLNTPDEDVWRYLAYFTFLTLEEQQGLKERHAAKPGARVGQAALAHEVTKLVHGEKRCEEVAAAASLLFGHAKSQEDFERIVPHVPGAKMIRGTFDGILLVDLLAASSLCDSRSDAKRLVQGGGAYLNNNQVRDLGRKLMPIDLIYGRYVLLRKGKADYFVWEVDNDNASANAT